MDHTYDRSFLVKYLSDIREQLKEIARPHLTDKSVGRIDQVLDFFCQGRDS